MTGFMRRRLRRTTLWLGLFVGVLAGLGCARTGLPFAASWIAVAGFGTVVLLPGRSWLALAGLAALGFCCGGWRGVVYMHELSVYRLLERQPVTVTVKALDNAIYNDRQQLSFDASNIILDGRPLPGKIQVSGYGENAVFQGDELLVSGKLYPGYGTYQAKMSFSQFTLAAHHPNLVSVFRQRFIAGTQSALPEPLAPFVMGLLVGQRATLPEGVKEDLKMVGLTHIIAVSGYNLTIILQASKRVFGRQSKRIATFLSLGLIALFLLLTGGGASIIRAAIVSVLSIAAGYYGRSFKPLNLLLLAASITALANPVFIWSDLGWYLSFLAFYGVMLLSPLVQARWPARWHQTLLGGIALESICAEVMSLPLVLYIFGQMSLVGLPANILVVALVPLAMLLGFLAGLAGMMMPSLAGWVAWPACQMLNYMLDTAHLLASLPHIFIQNRSLELAGMLGLYVTIAAVTVLLWRRTKGGHVPDWQQKIVPGSPGGTLAT